MSQPFTEPPQRPNLDPYAQARAPHGAGAVVKYAFLLVSLALVVRVGFSFSEQLQARREKAEADKQAATEAKDAAEQLAVHPSPAAQVTTADVNHAEARAKLDWAKARQREVIRLVEQLKRRTDEWRTELGRWNQSVVSLLTNDEGRPLAADPDLTRSFRAVFNQPQVDSARIDEIDASAADLTRGVVEAVDDASDAYLPNEGVEAKLREMIAEAQAGADAVRQASRQISILLEDAVRKKLQGERTLQEAITEQERAEQVELTAEARERLDAARRAAAAKVAAAEEEAVRTAGEVEARRILDAAAAAKTKQQAAEEKRRLDEERQKRIAAMEADMADIKQYLGAFITDGYSQPNGAFNADGAELGPMSWSKLSAVGALKPTQAGMEQLMRCATLGNDRDHTGFPQYVGGDDAWRNTNKEFLKRAQELLTKHSEALIAKGLLAP